MEKTEAVEQARIQEAIQAKQIVSDFKAKTNEMFHEISGLDAEDMEMAAMAHILSKIDDYGLDVEIMDIAVTGSRCRGLEQESSDIDIAVEYKGGEREDDLFRVFNEDGLKIGGVRVDINPITEGKTGTLAAYLPGVESYLEEKRAAMEQASVKEQATILAAEINEFLCFCNPRQYEELVKNRDAQVASIRKNIEKGNTKYLSDFLNSVIAMGVRDGVTDIFGEGTKPDDSRPVQMVRKAKVLLDRLAEYRPLAKENLNARISIKEKLAEKKAVIEKRDKAERGNAEKDTEKKVHREM